MPDREKVIKGLECHAKGSKGCLFDCPYGNENGCQLLLCSDALALLKEDETRIQYLNDHIEMCKEEVERLHKEQENASKRKPVIVCPHCGKRVK